MKVKMIIQMTQNLCQYCTKDKFSTVMINQRKEFKKKSKSTDTR